LHLIIWDDGIGFDEQAIWSRCVPEVNLGLQGMQERALIVGGQITIKSTPRPRNRGEGAFSSVPTSCSGEWTRGVISGIRDL
jgi:signal transduction histidine kinase